MKTTGDTMKVWDPIVRLGHWTLVLAFFVAYFTEDEFLTQHVWAGYVVGAVVAIRLLWGFIGSKHARFSDFVRSPVTILRDMRDLLTGRSKRYIGHSPVGGAMIVALLITLSVTVYSGLELYAVEENAGPFASWEAVQLGRLSPIASAYADENESEDEQETGEAYWEDLHELFANLTLLLVGLHIAGVMYTSVIHKENLVKAMITGRKRRNPS